MDELEIMTRDAALARAKALLGPRAQAFREAGLRVIARAEITLAGSLYQRIYGRADTWDAALSQAIDSYADMRRHPERTT